MLTIRTEPAMTGRSNLSTLAVAYREKFALVTGASHHGDTSFDNATDLGPLLRGRL